ncbi:unknown function [Vibrio phage D479]
MNCVVCKQPIKEGEPVVETPQGTVHTGTCHQHLQEMAMTESTDQLNQVELLV